MWALGVGNLSSVRLHFEEKVVGEHWKAHNGEVSGLRVQGGRRVGGERMRKAC